MLPVSRMNHRCTDTGRPLREISSIHLGISTAEGERAWAARTGVGEGKQTRKQADGTKAGAHVEKEKPRPGEVAGACRQ